MTHKEALWWIKATLVTIVIVVWVIVVVIWFAYNIGGG